MKSTKPRSLKSKALQLLAQREQSRVELRRKLLAHALASSPSCGAADRDTGAGALGAAAAPDAAGVVDEIGGPGWADTADAARTAAEQVSEVLAWLDAYRFQSDERFAESRVHARAGRFGDLRIRQELKQHGIALAPAAARALLGSELSRAESVLERRFGARPPSTAENAAEVASEIARQSRFLTARGFSPETVRQVLKRVRARRTGSGAAIDDDG